MKKIFAILMTVVICFPVFSQSNWTPIIVEGKKAYSITSTDTKGNKCNILLFYDDDEAWFTMPDKIVEHDEYLVPVKVLAQFGEYDEKFVIHTVSYDFTYIEDNTPETIQLWGRNWSCMMNDKLDQKLDTIISSTIVVCSLGSSPFFDYIMKSQGPVVLKLPTATGDLIFRVPVLKINSNK